METEKIRNEDLVKRVRKEISMKKYMKNLFSIYEEIYEKSMKKFLWKNISKKGKSHEDAKKRK